MSHHMLRLPFKKSKTDYFSDLTPVAILTVKLKDAKITSSSHCNTTIICNLSDTHTSLNTDFGRK